MEGVEVDILVLNIGTVSGVCEHIGDGEGYTLGRFWLGPFCDGVIGSNFSCDMKSDGSGRCSCGGCVCDEFEGECGDGV